MGIIAPIVNDRFSVSEQIQARVFPNPGVILDGRRRMSLVGGGFFFPLAQKHGLCGILRSERAGDSAASWQSHFAERVPARGFSRILGMK